MRSCSLTSTLRFISMNTIPNILILAFLLVPGLGQDVLSEPSPCSLSDIRLPPTNPVYRDSMALRQFLSARGIVVYCVLLSKEERLLKGEEGAANFQTPFGSFEALFFHETDTVRALRVVERREPDEYVYSFGAGTHFSAQQWESATPIYFFKHGNTLFHTLDKKVASELRKGFQPA